MPIPFFGTITGKSILTVSLCLVFLNCSTSEEPDNTGEEINQEVIYLTVNVNQTYHTEETDNWIVIHDENGNLLDYRSFETGDTIEFKASPETVTGRLNVTRLNVLMNQQATLHSFDTESEVAIGSVLNYGTNYIPPAGPTRLGVFSILLKDVPAPKKIMVTNEIGIVNSSSSGTGYNGLWEVELQISRYEGINDYLISIIDGFDNYRYYYMNNASGEYLELDYASQFQAFDRVLEVDLPPHERFIVQTAGFYEDEEISQWNGVWMQDLISGIDEVDTNPLKIVYLDRFDKFRTYFNIFMDGYSYHRRSFGPEFSILEIPEKPEFTILDPSRDRFRFNTEVPYVLASWTFYFQAGSYDTNDRTFTRWIVSAQSGYEPNLGIIPGEIVETYPLMNLDDMEITGIDLYLQKGENLFSSAESITLKLN